MVDVPVYLDASWSWPTGSNRFHQLVYNNFGCGSIYGHDDYYLVDSDSANTNSKYVEWLALLYLHQSVSSQFQIQLSRGLVYQIQIQIPNQVGLRYGVYFICNNNQSFPAILEKSMDFQRKKTKKGINCWSVNRANKRIESIKLWLDADFSSYLTITAAGMTI